jgi:hypothetical protein
MAANPHRRAKKHSADSVFVLILVCAFAICSLFVILFGAQVYSGVRARSEENDTVRSGLMFLRNKVRAHDRPDSIRVSDGVLMLSSEPYWGIFETRTYIFYRDGALYEHPQFSAVGEEPMDLSDVSAFYIMPASGFYAAEVRPGVFALTVYAPDGTPYTTTVAVRADIAAITAGGAS